MNILLIDDHVLFAKSLEIAFEDYTEVSSFRSVQEVAEVIKRIEEKRPDILLVDINLSNISEEDGLIVAQSISNAYPDLNIVILTGFDLPVYRYEAKKAGARGFINKNVSPDQLLHILLQIHAGCTYFPDEEEEIEQLTEQETKILQMLSDGYKREEVADSLFISKRTVSNHIQHIFDKLHVNSALEAVTKGIKLGYVKTYKQS